MIRSTLRVLRRWRPVIVYAFLGWCGVIAEAPDAADKTPADLRNAAEVYEHEAERKDRLASAQGNKHPSRRAAARAKSRERKSDRLRLHAEVCRAAAEEIERRGCPTVGEATKSLVVRKMRKALRREFPGIYGEKVEGES